ncbi:MAG: MOSC domain-containing protein [Chitinophagales bacterium]
MPLKPFISRISIFPIKSLDGISLDSAKIVEGGCLEHDREFAIFDREGEKVKGKNNDRIFSLRSMVDFENDIVSFRKQGDPGWSSFQIYKERKAINSWLSAYFGFPVELHQDKHGNFLDIPGLSGATLLSRASLESVAGWFDGMQLEAMRKRFRATIEIDGVIAFWEDQLFASPGAAIAFELGKTKMLGVSPRERCSVPTRDPQDGEILHGFPKTFSRHRAGMIPSWSALNEYSHFYHLSVDCQIPESETGKTLKVGDELNILGKIDLIMQDPCMFT